MNNYKLPVKKRIMLRAEHILRFFIGQDEQMDDLIIFHNDKFDITATDAGLYQAIGSIKDYDNFNKAKLVKFLEGVTIIPARKLLLTHERVSQLRNIALKKAEENK